MIFKLPRDGLMMFFEYTIYKAIWFITRCFSISVKALSLLNHVVTILSKVREAVIVESESKYQSALSKITSCSKKYKDLGKEFNQEVTKHSNNLYSNITGNKGLYKACECYTSYGTKTYHLHIFSKACKLFDSNLYKGTISVSQWVEKNPVAFNFLSMLLTSGGVAAINGIKNGLSASKKPVYIDINNPKRYAFAGSSSNGITISLSLPDIKDFAMTLSKEQQVALGYAFAADGVGGGGPSNQQRNTGKYIVPKKKYYTNQDYNIIRENIELGNDIEFSSKK